jgi:hypothetical protein
MVAEPDGGRFEVKPTRDPSTFSLLRRGVGAIIFFLRDVQPEFLSGSVKGKGAQASTDMVQPRLLKVLPQPL